MTQLKAWWNAMKLSIISISAEWVKINWITTACLIYLVLYSRVKLDLLPYEP
jgi:hypothetical protein